MNTGDTLIIADEDAMMALGAQLAQRYAKGGLIYLDGELGAGKTTLVRGLLRALGHESTVKSPTYTLVETYHLKGRDIYHFDLYRLSEPEELEYMGIRDYLNPQALVLIEWPEKGVGVLPKPDLQLDIRYHSSGRRIYLK